MGNIVLAYDNQADTVTGFFGSGTAAAGYPVANLKDYRLWKKFRSTNALAANTKVGFQLPALFFTELVGLMVTNASVNAQFRVRLYSDAGATVQVHDSGVKDLFPAGSMPEAQIPAGSSNSGTARPTAAETKRFQRNIVYLLPAGVQARSGQIDITDTANPDGYFEAGRLMVARRFEPVYGPAYGEISLRLTSRTEATRARDGTPYFNTLRPDFCLPFGLKFLNFHEAMRLVDLQALVDVSGEIWAGWDPSEPAYWWRRQVFGRLKTLDAIEHPLFANYGTAFQVEGTL